jgi:cysteinyl-tRNA synthetase
VEGRKMSKTLGNYFTLRDLFEKGFSGREIRFLLISSHYRESFNFTLEGLTGAKTALGRIDEMVGKLRDMAGETKGPANEEILNQFSEAMDEDLNVAGGWGHIFEWVRATNRSLAENKMSAVQAASALAAWEKLDTVLGLAPKAQAAEVPAEIQQLLEARQTARKEKDFRRADEIRVGLKAKGWVIEDTPKGPKLKRV